jgi:hypothetical protein
MNACFIRERAFTLGAKRQVDFQQDLMDRFDGR